MPDDLHYLTIAAASEALRTRRISPVELTEAFLARIAALDGRLNSYILVLGETARAEAKAAEAEIAAGRWRGPLHGIPIALKDIYNTAGIATTGHSALFRDHVPTADAFTVRKLREAGAVVLGKASTWEFAIGGSSFDLPWPPARNPWDLARDPSGSSSGSGAAVAAGLAMGAMGSDTGGSIRGPASWCGIAGHKPTYGLVSRAGVLPLSFALDHAGPMCWTAEDCALMLDVLAGHDPADPASADWVAGPFTAGMGGRLDGVRVGVVRHFFETDTGIDADTARTTSDTLAALAEMGAVLSDVTLPTFEEFNSIATVISRSEAYTIHADHLKRTPELYGALGRQRLMAGAFFTAADYIGAQRHRALLVATVAEVLRGVDVLVFPTARHPATEIGENTMGATKQPFLNRPFNVTGSPAVSVCNGFSTKGLPIGFQIGGRPFEDALVLRVGDAVERAMGTRTRRPSF
jgi:aspartyl-tRNA(Asn)/glutamyl-tRNA(Gln) amidotransferase subunit A